MTKRQPGSSQGGLRTKPSGKSPRFRANQLIELAKQQDVQNAQAERRKPEMFGSMSELMKSRKKR